MINVWYTLNSKGHKLRINGHADYDTGGRDIVCAAVSSISFALLGFLENNANETSDYYHQRDSGYLTIVSCESPKVNAAFEMAVIGLMQIANKYPDNVTVNISATGGDSREETANY